MPRQTQEDACDVITMNWLRVFRRAVAPRMGAGERRLGRTQAVRSEKRGAGHGTTSARHAP